MASKEIKKEYTAYDYVWNGECPICGKKQSGDSKYIADMLCDDCLKNRLKEKINMNSNKIVGSIIIDFVDNNDLGYSFTILTKDGVFKRINIFDKFRLDIDNTDTEAIIKLTDIKLIRKVGNTTKETLIKTYKNILNDIIDNIKKFKW